MNTSTRTLKPCFCDICAMYAFNSQRLQELATISGISQSIVEAMCNGMAVGCSDAEKVLATFSQLTRREWTLDTIHVLLTLPTFADLSVSPGFDAASLSRDADIPIAIVDQMLCNYPVSRDDAGKVLHTLSRQTGQSHTLENVVVKLSDKDTL